MNKRALIKSLREQESLHISRRIRMHNSTRGCDIHAILPNDAINMLIQQKERTQNDNNKKQAMCRPIQHLSKTYLYTERRPGRKPRPGIWACVRPRLARPSWGSPGTFREPVKGVDLGENLLAVYFTAIIPFVNLFPSPLLHLSTGCVFLTTFDGVFVVIPLCIFL